MSLRLPRKRERRKSPNAPIAAFDRGPKTKVNILSKPTFMLVGTPVRTGEISRELEAIGLIAKKVQFVKEIKEKYDGTEVGIIYVAPLSRSHILSVHKNLMKDGRFKDVPFFAAVPSWVSGRTEREMYKSGIRMIFEWPREKNTFASLMATALSVGTDPVRTDDTDESLKKAIENRLSGEYGHFEPDVNTIVYNGIAILRGELSSSKRKKILVGNIKKVPGVRGVVDHSLTVTRPKLSAKMLKKKANEVLEMTNGNQDKTMEVLVNKKNLNLILTGTAPNRESVERAKERLGQLYGVAFVDDRVIVSEVVHKSDVHLANRAQRMAKKITLGTGNKVKIKVSAGVALLKGQVNSGVESSLLGEAVESLNGVTEIDNRLSIGC